MKYIVILAFCFTAYSCGNSNTASTAAPQTIDGANYILEAIPGSSTQLARQEDAEGNVLLRGQMENGLKVGTWLSFEAGKEFPTRLETYVGGIKNGPSFEFNDRGQINVVSNFKNDAYHGKYAKYRFSRPEVTAEYKDGNLHGIYKEYFQRDGKIQKEMSYTDGKLDGPYRFYNEEGAITVEYIYKNGEKISGGIIDPGKDNTPK